MIQPNEKIIVALDASSVLQNRVLFNQLESKISFFKIGLRIFIINGFKLIDEIKEKRKKVFLDLKLYDIKSTIQETVAKISEHQIDFLTVNGDPSIVEAAVNGRKNKNIKILAVTFLTNQNRNDLNLSLIKEGSMNELVAERANNAFMAGADGIVCSPLEASYIRKQKEFNKKIIVTPGIRLKKTDSEDQKRISTPSEAIKSGANYIVIGRPIWQSEDPKLAVDNFLSNMSQ